MSVLNFKVPVSLRENLSSLQRAWRMLGEAQGASEEQVKRINLTYVCNRLLEEASARAVEEHHRWERHERA